MDILECIGKLFGKGRPTLKSLSVDDLKREHVYESLPMSDTSTLDTYWLDRRISVYKAVAGTLPMVGPALAETTSLIPQQRFDRVVKFLKILDKRVEALEMTEDERRQLFSQEGAFEFFEEACEQATRASSEDRRQYLAGVVARGLTSNEIDIQESQHLLKMFREVNDIELLILRLYWDLGVDRDVEFRRKYHDLVIPPTVYVGCSEKIIHRASLQESYRKHLESLGLLAGDYRPRLDQIDNSIKYEITILGRLLLKFVGIVDNLNPAP